MYRHFLIAIDGSEVANRALSQGIELAKLANAKVTFITITEPWVSIAPDQMIVGFPADMYDKAATAEASRILTEARSEAARLGLSFETLHIKDRYPAEAILEAAENLGCDLIVMGSHGRHGIARFLLGSQSAKVVAHSKKPVLICRS